MIIVKVDMLYVLCFCAINFFGPQNSVAVELVTLSKRNALLSEQWPAWEWDLFSNSYSSVCLCRTTTVTLWVLSSVPLHSFLRSMYLTGNQRCASPMTVSMWCWTAWTGIQSMRFTWWQRISRDGRSPASAPSEQLQSPLPSQVLFPSTHPEHPHTHTQATELKRPPPVTRKEGIT